MELSIKLAVVLPLGPVRPWHLSVIERLRAIARVEVCFSRGERRLPLIECILGLEATVARHSGTGILAPPLPFRPEHAGLGRELDDLDITINLTGRPLNCRDSDVLSVFYDNEISERAVWGRLLAGEPPIVSIRDSEGVELAVSFPAIPETNRLSPLIGAIRARTTTLIARAVEQRASRLPLPHSISVGRPPQRYSSGRLLSRMARAGAKAAHRRLRNPRSNDRAWTIGLRRSGVSPPWPETGGFKFLPRASDRFYADPFLAVENGRTFLFAEELRFGSNRGTIVCADLSEGPELTFHLALIRPYHLSYPFTFRYEGTLYMVPEASESGRVELFRCSGFPDNWRLAHVLLDFPLLDPTLVCHDGLFWLFGTPSSPDQSTQDELFAFFSTRLYGPWEAHPRNPIKSDVRSSRPAGRFLKHGGRLLRPAQDCSSSYGGGLVWCEVLELTRTEYRERELRRWSGSDLGHFDGVHTYDANGEWEVVDVREALTRRNSRI